MRDGRIAQAGPPEEVYRRPADTFVATFVGSPKMNLIDGAVSGGELRTSSGVRIAVGGPDAAAVTVGVRPDDVILTPDAGNREGSASVELVELLGPRAIVTVRAADLQLTSVVEASALTDIKPGAGVRLSARDVHRFDVTTGVRLDD
jgi:multiple sugar transport system ATP-binding protein